MNTLEIQMLGPSGAGKTVFMSSLYSRLRLRRPENTFYLRTDIETSLGLNAIYNKVVVPTGAWPVGTQVSRNWDFGVAVPTATDDLEPLRVRYTDYAGGILTESVMAAKVENGQVLQKLPERARPPGAARRHRRGEAGRGEAAGFAYFARDLATSFEIAQQSNCPVHFVVTKWDLLEPEFSLGAVRNALFGNDDFAALATAKASTSRAPIRLIRWQRGQRVRPPAAQRGDAEDRCSCTSTQCRDPAGRRAAGLHAVRPTRPAGPRPT